MIKKLLSLGLLALTFQSATAQTNLAPGAKMAGPVNRKIASISSQASGPTVQTVSIQDTLWYFYNKYQYKTPAALTGFYTVKSPYTNVGAKISHFGNTYLNTSTITVSGLFSLVARGATSSPSVNVRILLCNATAAGVPILPAIDSITSVLTGTTGIFAGGTLATPRTITGNFSVLYRNASPVVTDTILGFMASSTPTTGISFGDGLSYIRVNGTIGTTLATFTSDYEFQTIPVVSFQATASASVASLSSCAPATYTLTNTTASPLLTNRQFNLNTFLARWKPFAGATPPVGDSVYVWNPGDGTGTVNNMPNTLVHVYNTVGSYTGSLTANYQLMADNGQKKTDIKTFSVTVSSTGAINATASSTVICAGQSSTLSVSGASTYTWSPAASLSSANGSSVVSTPASTTVYTITGTSSCGTGTTTITQNVNSTIPTVSITASTPTVCSGSAVTFTASGATNYVWTPGGTPTSTVTVTPTSSTTYTVMGTTSGCTGTKTVAVSVTQNPTVTATASSNTLCAGSSATLTANGNGTGYAWSTGAFTQTISVTPTATTSYSVGTANGSCYGTSVVMITVSTCTTSTGIAELEGYTINIYPNPNTGVLNVVIPSELASNSSVEIFDALGKLVLSQNLTAEQNSVNTSVLTTGVYIFKVINANKAVKIGRMIKQ